MPLLTPTDDFLKASAARARRREQAEKERRERVKSRFRLALYAGSILLLAALMADLRNFSRRFAEGPRATPLPRKGDAADVLRGLDGPRYVDPAGRFSLVPPRNWVKLDPPPTDFYDVVFQGPYGMDLSIQTAETRGMTFDELIGKLRDVERGLSAETHMDIAYVGKHRAVKRSARLFRSKVLLLDFLTGDLAHHVQFSMPPETYDEYEPVFLRLMETYEAGRLLPEAGAPAAAP